MNRKNLEVRAQRGKNGLDIYLVVAGIGHYITTRRSNGPLWSSLKEGMRLRDLKRFKPGYTRREQKIYKSTQYFLKVVDDFIKYEITV